MLMSILPSKKKPKWVFLRTLPNLIFQASWRCFSLTFATCLPNQKNDMTTSHRFNVTSGSEHWQRHLTTHYHQVLTQFASILSLPVFYLRDTPARSGKLRMELFLFRSRIFFDSNLNHKDLKTNNISMTF